MNEFEEEFIPEMNMPGMIPSMDANETQFIIDQLNKCCCKIGDGKGSGFLCKLSFPNSNNIFLSLMTNNHVLGKDAISKGKKINFSFENDKYPFSIIIDDSRITHTSVELDVTIIEIRESDNLDIKSFLEVDENIYENNALDNYKQKSIYLLHYPHGIKSNFSFGVITDIYIDNYIISHKCSSEQGSSGGPLINILNKKVLGIHTGSLPKKKVNTGIFFKPIVEDFFNKKYKDLEKKYNNIEKKQYQNVYNDNKKYEKINKNLDFFHKNSLYYLILFLSICFNCNMYKALIPPYIFICKKSDFDIKMFCYFMFICLDIIFGIILFIAEKFINYRIIILLSLIILLYEGPLNITNFFGLKMLKTAIFNIIPIWNINIIYEINIGEVISNFILLFIYHRIEEKEEDLIINYGAKILNSVIIIYTLIIIIFNNSLFSKLREKEKEKIKSNIYKLYYFKKKWIFYLLIASNYCFTFSFYPLIYFLNTYYSVNKYILFAIFDLLGRILAILIYKKINKDLFKSIVFFRFIIFFIVPIFLDNEAIEMIIFLIVSTLSGFCTSFSYYYLLKIKNESKRDNFIYLLKLGKYLMIFKLSDENKPLNVKKFD
jgi:hypothetical protein